MNPFYAKEINTYYGSRQIIKDISFRTEPGTVLGLAGPNGCGKTTLIRSLCNIIPHQGTCGFEKTFEQMNEKEISKLCSYLPQRSGIALDMSVLDVVLMGFNPILGPFQNPGKEMNIKAFQVLKETGLNGKEECSYFTLSGGEKQLCLLARTLVVNKPLLLMDEPENSLDPSVRIRIMELIRNRIKNGTGSAIISFHDINLALHFCDRILLMNEGQIQSELDPEKEDPENIESKLSDIFGNICVRKLRNRKGIEQLVMLSEMD